MARHDVEPGVQELFDAVAACRLRAVSFQGIVLRSTGILHAAPTDFISGEGAAKSGGRWNPRGIKAIYCSTTPTTAACEAYQNFAVYGFARIRPRVFCGAKLDLQLLLDLTDLGIRRRLGFNLAEMLEEDWLAIQDEGDESWTQTIGRGAHMAGFEGLIAPSAQDRPHGVNLVLFPDNSSENSSIQVLGVDDLPAHPPK